MAAMLALSGCAGTTGMANDPSLTPAQQQLQQQSSRRFTITVLEGTAVGAVVGAGAGAIAGGGKGAAIGAGAGALVGTGVGWLVARANGQQANTEQTLGDQISVAQQAAQSAQQSAQASAQIAAEARSKVAFLDAQYERGQLTAAGYQQQMASYRNSANQMEQQIGKMNEEAQTLRTNASTAKGADNGQLGSAAQQIARSRDDQQRALAQLRSSLSEVPAG
jgi:outer membrane lipoprotein SlyB